MDSHVCFSFSPLRYMLFFEAERNKHFTQICSLKGGSDGDGGVLIVFSDDCEYVNNQQSFLKGNCTMEFETTATELFISVTSQGIDWSGLRFALLPMHGFVTSWIDIIWKI